MEALPRIDTQELEGHEIRSDHKDDTAGMLDALIFEVEVINKFTQIIRDEVNRSVELEGVAESFRCMAIDVLDYLGNQYGPLIKREIQPSDMLQRLDELEGILVIALDKLSPDEDELQCQYLAICKVALMDFKKWLVVSLKRVLRASSFVYQDADLLKKINPDEWKLEDKLFTEKRRIAVTDAMKELKCEIGDVYGQFSSCSEDEKIIVDTIAYKLKQEQVKFEGVEILIEEAWKNACLILSEFVQIMVEGNDTAIATPDFATFKYRIEWHESPKQFTLILSSGYSWAYKKYTFRAKSMSLRDEIVVTAKAFHKMVFHPVDWLKPEEGWVKLNIDVYRNDYSSKMGIGGVIRDRRGNWVVGFMKKIEKESYMLELEILALKEGLCLAKEIKNIKEEELLIEIETVCDQLETHMTNAILNYECTLKKYCTGFQYECSQVLKGLKYKFNTVESMCSEVALMLAREGSRMISELKVLHETPNELYVTLLEESGVHVMSI